MDNARYALYAKDEKFMYHERNATHADYSPEAIIKLSMKPFPHFIQHPGYSHPAVVPIYPPSPEHISTDQLEFL